MIVANASVALTRRPRPRPSAAVRDRDRCPARRRQHADHAAVQQRELRMVGRLAEHACAAVAARAGWRKLAVERGRGAGGVDDVGPARPGSRPIPAAASRAAEMSRLAAADAPPQPAPTSFNARHGVHERGLVGHVEGVVGVLRPPPADEVGKRSVGVGRVEVARSSCMANRSSTASYTAAQAGSPPATAVSRSDGKCGVRLEPSSGGLAVGVQLPGRRGGRARPR